MQLLLLPVLLLAEVVLDLTGREGNFCRLEHKKHSRSIDKVEDTKRAAAGTDEERIIGAIKHANAFCACVVDPGACP